MAKLPLSFACWNYDRIGALIDGTVQPKGIELNHLNLEVEEIFWRMMRHQEFDVAELSLSSFLIASDRGFPEFRAIPVFMSRSFRHSSIYVHTGSGIREAGDLRGRRIGLPEYQLTACLWARGILEHEYGVHPSDVLWYTGGEETPGRIEKVAVELPDNIRIQPIPEDLTLNGMLESGELDAMIAPRAPSSLLRGSSHVARLFPNYPDVEAAYYQKTGIFPIMHVVVIREDVLEKHPWIAMNLYEAFELAKRKVYEGFAQTAALKVTLPWLTYEVERTRSIMGDDFWPYGLEANRKTLEAAISFSFEQGLIHRRLRLEDLFAASTLERYII